LGRRLLPPVALRTAAGPQRGDVSVSHDRLRVAGLHPIHPLVAGQAPAEGLDFHTARQPYASALWQRAGEGGASSPVWYAKKDDWRATLLASRKAMAKAAEHRDGLPYWSRVLRQKDVPQHIRVNVSGLRRLTLVCTIGGDNFNYDDTIWADPKLIAKDGKETSLVDLKPLESQVGFMTLFVNENYAGKRLSIGDRPFQRGFWAHAPSVLVFDLGGKYEWFDTWFGLDALAVQPGSSEFGIGEDAASATPRGAAEAALLRLARCLADGVRGICARTEPRSLGRSAGPAGQRRGWTVGRNRANLGKRHRAGRYRSQTPHNGGFHRTLGLSFCWGPTLQPERRSPHLPSFAAVNLKVHTCPRGWER
jgi:hypothetical protein